MADGVKSLEYGATSSVKSSDMKKVALVVLASVALVLSTGGTSHAWHGGHFHGGGHVVIGVGPWWGPWPYWYPPYYAYPYYPYPPVVATQEPPEYIEQPRAAMPQPGQPSGQPEWYYCPSAKAYYPDVQNCPEEWVKVPPRTQ